MSEKQFLSREEILGADDIQYRTVEVPEWGGSVRIQTLTGEDRDEYETSLVRFDADSGKAEAAVDNLRCKLLVACIVDEHGKRQFSASDVAALGKKSGAALDRVFDAAKKLNRIGEEEVEELVKNSGAVPSDE